MFLVGVIPGPNEPPLTAINHYLTPLVDEFQSFWDTGVRFSQTQNFLDGRLVPHLPLFWSYVISSPRKRLQASQHAPMSTFARFVTVHGHEMGMEIQITINGSAEPMPIVGALQTHI